MNELPYLLAIAISNIVYMVALTMGCLMVLVVCVVFLKERKIQLGGLAFSFLGILLIGMSVWSNINFTAGQFSAQLTNLEKQSEKVLNIANKAKSETKQAILVANTAKQETENALRLAEEGKSKATLALKRSQLSLNQSKNLTKSLVDFKMKNHTDKLLIKPFQDLDIKKLEQKIKRLDQ